MAIFNSKLLVYQRVYEYIYIYISTIARTSGSVLDSLLSMFQVAPNVPMSHEFAVNRMT